MENLRSLRAADLMTRNVFAIPSRSTVKEAAQMLLFRRISGAPVIDATRNCVGVVSLRDIARYRQSRSDIRVFEHDFYSLLRLDDASPVEIGEFAVERDANETVDRIMTPLVLAVEEEAPLAEVLRLIIHHHIHRIFVMNEDRHLVGIVSTIDILGALQRWVEAAPADPPAAHPAGEDKGGRRAARRRPRT